MQWREYPGMGFLEIIEQQIVEDTSCQCADQVIQIRYASTDLLQIASDLWCSLVNLLDYILDCFRCLNSCINYLLID